MLNSYGLDARYFKEKLSLIVRDINHYTPAELKRELEKLVNVLEEIRRNTVTVTLNEGLTSGLYCATYNVDDKQAALHKVLSP